MQRESDNITLLIQISSKQEMSDPRNIAKNTGKAIRISYPTITRSGISVPKGIAIYQKLLFNYRVLTGDIFTL